MELGPFLRTHRERRRNGDPDFSLRRVAARVGIEPSYLSKIERGTIPPPGEDLLKRLGRDLGIHPDLLLGMAGKVSAELQEVIRRRPVLFGSVLRELRDLPDEEVVRVLRAARAGRR